MKKNNFLLLSIFLSLVSTLTASNGYSSETADCKWILEDKIADLKSEKQSDVGSYTSSGVMSLSTAGIALVDGNPLAAGYWSLFALGSLAGAGSTALTLKYHVEGMTKIISIIDQAQAGDGIDLRVLFQELQEDGSRSTFEEMSQFIVKANHELMFCDSRQVLSYSDFTQFLKRNLK